MGMERIKRKITDIRQSKEQLAGIGEIAFIGYYGIMVITKTFGYVSYEMFFKLSFLLALCCLGLKIILTHYTMREFLILYLMLAVSAVCWLRVGEKNIMFITLTLWGMKNVKFTTLLKATVWIRVFGTALMIALACAGMMDLQPSMDMATDYSEFVVYAFGYIKSNAAFYIVFATVAILLYLYYDVLNFWHFLGSLVICLAVFEATYCRTGMIVFGGMWALILLDKMCRNKKYYYLLSYHVVALFGISMAAMVIYRKASPVLFQINRIFNGRIEIANNYYKAYGTTLFPKTANIFWDMNYTTIDNFYMYLFISCGLIVTLFYVAAATGAQLRLYRRGCYPEIIFFVVFAVYAMLEQSPFNPILNPFILLIGNLIYKEGNFGVRKEITDFTSA